MVDGVAGASVRPTWLGHPRGLFLLFFVELWERFSFYGMRAILVLYLTKHFLLAEQPAYAIYGAYTSMVYITPILGGLLADRLLGARKAVLAGGIFITIGHLLIAVVEGPQGQQGSALLGFYLALAFVIVGTGFLKGNISVLVGALYPRDDIRRDGAFSIFYMGINTGAFVGPIIVGILGETVGWGWGFGAAGIGMALGLVAFLSFRRELAGVGEPPVAGALRRRSPIGISNEWLIYVGAILAVFASWYLVGQQGLVGLLLIAAAVVTVGGIIVTAVTKLPRQERDRLFAALFLIMLCPLFWALFEQTGSSLTLYTDQAVDRTILGFAIPASVFQSVNPAFIITLAPVFGAIWVKLGRRKLEPSAPFKFGIGLILVGAGFFALILGAPSQGLTPAIFVILLYLFHSAAELCFSPIGLSSMTRLSVKSMTGLMMGTWFLATAAGNFIAGLIAQATGGEGAGAEQVLEVYARIGWFAIGVGVVVLAVAPFVAKLMHLDTLGDSDHVLAGDPLNVEPASVGLDTRGERKP
ncbi:POT family proton-dependent oligopeptide transporter [Sphingomonas jinjuensis]|uniref:POT family proton-dependent oligopeptide transporter n=1 Tax=Sphingomonas jinjuensis TaxID=535907 RepID=A0A840FAJ7_9SPHN|nr:oligopeptide:H+ symporter [Sphingomonas jinjuensis]MBB4152527.1 POT family proton-dependent oligopeptide transporter [Sphingomonas jinjuensis]